MSRKYRFDFAISFAGADRSIAFRLVKCLQAIGLRIFFDAEYQSELIGEDLPPHFHKIYSKQAKHCIVLVSKAYIKSKWPRHELRAAQEAVLRGYPNYIIQVKIEDVVVPGLPSSLGYISLQDHNLEAIALLLYRKISLNPLALKDALTDQLLNNEFKKYCEILGRLAKKSNRLLITYVALGGSERMFFFEPAIKWFALQRRLCDADKLEIERILFFDGERFRRDEVYRTQIQFIYRSMLAFTRPILRVVAIKNVRRRCPVDMQIFFKDRNVSMILPIVSPQFTMNPEIHWEMVGAEDGRLDQARSLFKSYLKLPNHDRYLRQDRVSRGTNPVSIELDVDLCNLLVVP